MFKRTFATIAAAAGVLLAASSLLAQDTTTTETPEGADMTLTIATTTGYASVNGLEMYYEIYGEGAPLVLLHGGLADATMFAPMIPALTQGHQVIVVDLQAHGHTADIDRPMSYEAMAEDIAAMITQLGFENADIMGYSLGGGVALQTAIRHPEVVRKLVLVSTTFKSDGWYPEVFAAMTSMNAEAAEAMKQSPLYEIYAKAAPKLEDWPVLVTKVSTMLKNEYDWSADVAALKMPVLIVVGDSDSVRLTHAVEMFGLLGGGQKDGMSGVSNSQFAVLPATLHWGITFNPALIGLVTPFLDAPMPAAQ
jgi:pimeloyl-ACP methyl ester carboxylesterase